MYIYLDESYNLKDRDKKQCITINGFSVLDAPGLFKKWKESRKPFVGKRRIHARDSYFDALRPKVARLFAMPDVTLLTIFQAVQEIPFERERGYFKKGKLDFERVYAGLLEFADFISNMFYRAYQQDDDRFFQELKFKLIQIKNPL